MAQPYAVTYAWLRDDDAIAGETTSTHTVTKDDAGHALVCEVTAAGAGTPTPAPPSPTARATSVPPQLGGDLRVGGIVTCSSGGWDGTYAFTYQWLRDGDPIALATRASTSSTRWTSATSSACRVTADGPERRGQPRRSTPQQRRAAERAADHRRPAPRRHAHLRPRPWDADYTLTYAWSSGGSDPDAHGRRAPTLGGPLICAVTAQGLATETSAPVTPTAPINRGGPGIDGDARLGRTAHLRPRQLGRPLRADHRVAARRRARSPRAPPTTSSPPTSSTACAAASPPPGSRRRRAAPRSSRSRRT